MPSDGLRTLRPRQSFRRLRTALTPSLLPRSESASSTLSPRPTSPSSSSSRFSGYSFGNNNLSALSITSPSSSSSSRRVIRRKKSSVEMEQDEERLIAGSLVGLVEPRPYAGPTLGGIEEVLDGRV
ncbi:hypothetical protein B0A50_05844 [Salinomyces thailandicus]|uniref:Uncharacterized protein n=1 Tax=Salinomyces thailandicus TaxID=706561 RepID=A0A4U0TU92_9PEZI|nr:hypothetical protein B0A50_05844 [Salinomyces thailandica]